MMETIVTQKKKKLNKKGKTKQRRGKNPPLGNRNPAMCRATNERRLEICFEETAVQHEMSRYNRYHILVTLQLMVQLSGQME